MTIFSSIGFKIWIVILLLLLVALFVGDAVVKDRAKNLKVTQTTLALAGVHCLIGLAYCVYRIVL